MRNMAFRSPGVPSFGSGRFSYLIQAWSYILLTALLSFGCALTLIAPYDETTEKESARLQKQIDELITGIVLKGAGAPDEAARKAVLKYDEYQKEYVAISIDLRALKIRTEAIPMNTRTSVQVQYIIENFGTLERRHRSYSRGDERESKAVSMEDAYLESVRDILNAQFRALLALEFAKNKKTDIVSTRVE